MTEDRVETVSVEGAFMPRLLTHGDRVSWLDVLWEALWGFREDCIPEGDPMYDEQWDNICTAMAWIAEEIGVEGDPMYDEQWDNICTAMAWIAEEIGVEEKDLA